MTQEKKIHDILQNTFHITNFRTSQEMIVRHTLSGRHSLVLMPTGMGKSLCYQLPALLFDGLTVVMSPLIALMKDQVDSLKALGIDAEYINSSLGKTERERRYKKVKEGKYRLLFVAPERFRNSEFLDVISRRTVSFLAVDEAHCASQWGNDFRPDYSRLEEFREILGNPVTMALTATATRRVQEDIVAKLGIPPEEIEIFNEGISRPNLHLSVTEVIDYEEKYYEIEKLIKEAEGTTVIYFNLIKSIEAFSHHLERQKIRHMIYHGKLPPDKRKKIQQEFMKKGECLMLATNAFGMGIDRQDIRSIVHAELPGSIESYYQEIGRAGRDGLPSTAVLIYDEADLAVQMEFLEWQNPGAGFIKSAHVLFKRLQESLQSYTYEDLQEMLVYKNRGDHRLKTVLSLFDRHGVTTGRIDNQDLKLTGDLPDFLVNKEFTEAKIQADRERLYHMLQYVKTEECRRRYIHRYFSMEDPECGTCDRC